LVRRCAESLLQSRRDVPLPGGVGPADGLKLLALVDPKGTSDRARALDERLRDEPVYYNSLSQQAQPIEDGTIALLRDRIAFVGTLIELGLPEAVGKSLASLVGDLKKLGSDGLPVRTGPIPGIGRDERRVPAKLREVVVKSAHGRDALLRGLLKVLASAAYAEGFCDAIDRSGLATLDADSPCLAAKLRLLAAHCALGRGDVKGALLVAMQLNDERARGAWEAMTKKERSDLHRALAVIYASAGAFRDARAASESCDIADQLTAWSALLRRYVDGGIGSHEPADRGGAGPSRPIPVFDIVTN
jgi:hypothetical protein